MQVLLQLDPFPSGYGPLTLQEADVGKGAPATAQSQLPTNPNLLRMFGVTRQLPFSGSGAWGMYSGEGLGATQACALSSLATLSCLWYAKKWH